MPDVSKMKISDLIDFAEDEAEKKRQAPSLIEAGSPEPNASWADTLDILGNC